VRIALPQPTWKFLPRDTGGGPRVRHPFIEQVLTHSPGRPRSLSAVCYVMLRGRTPVRRRSITWPSRPLPPSRRVLLFAEPMLRNAACPRASIY